MIKSLLLIGLWSLIWPYHLMTQEHYNYANITQQDGMSSDNIVCMIQDHHGFMWIGTEYGLNRYDGQHFLKFRFDPQDDESLSGNSIYALYEDNSNRLWVGTLNGLNLLIKETGKFRRIPFQDAKGSKITARINGIYQDQKDNIWISTDKNGLFKIIDNQIADQVYAVPFAYQTDSLSFNEPIEKIEILHSQGEYLWVSTLKGIDRLHISSGKKEHWHFAEFDENYEANDHGYNDLWDGKGHIIFNRNLKHLSFIDIMDVDKGIRPLKELIDLILGNESLIEKRFDKIELNRHGNLIMISTEDVISFDLESGNYTIIINERDFNKQLISSYTTNDFIIDRNENIWFGTYGAGI